MVWTGKAIGRSAFCEQAALMTLGSKVCKTTGVMMVVKRFPSVEADVALMTAVAFTLAVEFMLITPP